MTGVAMCEVDGGLRADVSIYICTDAPSWVCAYGSDSERRVGQGLMQRDASSTRTPAMHAEMRVPHLEAHLGQGLRSCISAREPVKRTSRRGRREADMRPVPPLVMS